MDLRRLAEPFPPQDIAWRVSQADAGSGGIYCKVLAYITARAIQDRLDEVAGPGNWRNEPLTVHEVRPGVLAMQVGISIKIGDEWVTKYDVAESTKVEPAKGGFSGAMKRAGSQWGIGRYLYHLTEAFAEVSQTGGKGWKYAKLKSGEKYYWKPPQLPAWALPKDGTEDAPVSVTQKELNTLKADWRAKCAPGEKNRQALLVGFETFVTSVVGEFPMADPAFWTAEIVRQCRERLAKDNGVPGVSDDVPFGK